MAHGLGPVAFLALGAVLTAQQHTLVVDASSGPYFDLPAAVAASQPGDRIEIHAAATVYSHTVIDHGLDLDAAPGASVDGLTIQNLAPYHAVRVEGLTINGGPFFNTKQLLVDHCLGPVHVHRVSGSYMNLWVSNSPQVAVSNCAISGTAAGVFRIGGAVTLIGSSSVVAVNCQFVGGDGDGTVDGGNGIFVDVSSQVALVGCLARGGAGGLAWSCPSPAVPQASNGGNGVSGSGLVVVVGSSQIASGAAGVCSGSAQFNGWPGSASTVLLRAGPVVSVSGLSAGIVSIAEPPLMGSPVVLQQGTLANLMVGTGPGTVVLLGFDIWNAWQVPLPGNELPIVLPLATASLVGVATADVFGRAQFGIPIPTAPWVANQFAVFQGVAFTSQGLRLSAPGFARIR